MTRIAKNKVQVGMLVTCKEAKEAYYSRYAGQPMCHFTPNMIGRIAAIDVPCVRKESTFCCVDFYLTGTDYSVCPAAPNGYPWRVALEYDNITVVDANPIPETHIPRNPAISDTCGKGSTCHRAYIIRARVKQGEYTPQEGAAAWEEATGSDHVVIESSPDRYLYPAVKFFAGE